MCRDVQRLSSRFYHKIATGSKIGMNDEGMKHFVNL